MSNKPKAKSRLEVSYQEKRVKKEKSPRHTRSSSKNILKIRIPFKKYFRHLPTFFLAIPFYWLTYYILTSIFPDQIKDFLVFGSYLPLQIPFFLGNFFFFSFLTLKTRRGFFISLFISLVLFLKLQNVILDWVVMGVVLGGFVGVEIMSKVIID